MTGRIQDKVAIVSGGAQGIGEAIVRRFVAEGAKVVVADMQEAKGQALAEELGSAATFVRIDVSSTDDWGKAVETALKAFGRIDILVNNAGGAAGAGLLMNETEAAHRRTVDVNVTGVWAGMRAVLPTMIAQGGGSIVNISSMDGLVGVAEMATYAASKFAVTGMTRSLALEVGKDGVRVNSVHPGMIETPLTRGAPPASRMRIDRSVAHQPIPRMGKPEEIASAVLFFASDESLFCTGSALLVDGGHIAGPYREPTAALA